jgi:hypothetical protein
MRAFVEGVGLIGPGLNGWQSARPVLAGSAPYGRAATTVPAGELLPPAERRRTGVLVRLALAAGQEAMTQAGVNPATVATVFTSSSSDGDNLHAICESLARPAPEISPTRFHNSVHNAAAGYWGIATRSLERSTSLACFDGSFAAGLLEAAAQASVDRVPVGLIAYDMPYPEPLNAVRRVAASFGVAFILLPERGGRTLAQIDVAAVPARSGPTTMPDEELEALRIGVPAACSLPLLAALARGAREALVIDYLEGLQLQVSVAPCD